MTPRDVDEMTPFEFDRFIRYQNAFVKEQQSAARKKRRR